jgi:hypothetical protein
MLSRSILLSCIALFATCAGAATNSSSAADRYLDLNRCMDRTMGKGWQHRYDIHTQLNRWGVEEPSEADLDTAPQAVRMTALRCRRELSLVPQTSLPTE